MLFFCINVMNASRSFTSSIACLDVFGVWSTVQKPFLRGPIIRDHARTQARGRAKVVNHYNQSNADLPRDSKTEHGWVRRYVEGIHYNRRHTIVLLLTLLIQSLYF